MTRGPANAKRYAGLISFFSILFLGYCSGKQRAARSSLQAALAALESE
jgi:hypothetical protein